MTRQMGSDLHQLQNMGCEKLILCRQVLKERQSKMCSECTCMGCLWQLVFPKKINVSIDKICMSHSIFAWPPCYFTFQKNRNPLNMGHKRICQNCVEDIWEPSL
jgi:hypothetical protein